MNKEHVISDEILDQAQIEFSRNQHWVAYNTITYFLEKGDVYFFKDSDSAHEFSGNNISEYDNYRVMYARSMDELLKQIPYGEKLTEQLSNSTNLSIMNEKNLEYLKDNIKYMGFGEKLFTELENQLKAGQSEFQLTLSTEVNKKPFEAKLNFRKSDNSDMYFFNSYNATLERKNGEKLDQTFYLNKGKGVTAKEAYNLLEGRAVHKELSNKAGDPYKAWIQLDLENKDKNNNHEVKQFHENYGYDLKTTLSNYPIKEMIEESEKEKLIRSLEKGNMQIVTLDTPGKEITVFMEANPQYKTMNIYNSKMQRLDQDQRQELLKKPEIKEESKDLKQGMEQKEEVKQDIKKSAKQKPGDDLDPPKKKTSRKKGMSM
jgi:hypothetical protein